MKKEVTVMTVQFVTNFKKRQKLERTNVSSHIISALSASNSNVFSYKPTLFNAENCLEIWKKEYWFNGGGVSVMTPCDNSYRGDTYCTIDVRLDDIVGNVDNIPDSQIFDIAEKVAYSMFLNYTMKDPSTTFKVVRVIRKDVPELWKDEYGNEEGDI